MSKNHICGLTSCKHPKIARIILSNFPLISLTMVTVSEQPKQTVTGARLFNGCRRSLLDVHRKHWCTSLAAAADSEELSRRATAATLCHAPVAVKKGLSVTVFVGVSPHFC